MSGAHFAGRRPMIEGWDQIPTEAARAAAAGAIGVAECLGALYRGECTFLPMASDMPVERFREFARLTTTKPALVLLGDDDDQNRGPSAWPVARDAIRWAEGVLLHAAGAERWHYKMAIEAVQILRRYMIIECSTTTLPAWRDLVLAAPHNPLWLQIVPRGGAHPVRGVMQ